jgi:signal transduction histidine kinase
MAFIDRVSNRLTTSLSFRQRLALLFILTLIAVQALTAILAYGVVRSNLVEQGKSRLEATTQVFMRQLNVLSERVSDDVQVLSLDYALRKAVAEDDRGTALSALRNHGNRVGATRMAIVGLDGTITIDTTSEAAQGTPFPFTDLLDSAAANDQGTALAVLDGVIYWIVVVPVRAPDPVAFIAAGVPINDALLERLRELSLVTQSLAVATPDANGGWTVIAKTAGYTPVIQLPAPTAVPQQAAILSTEQSGQSLAMSARLATSEASAPVIAILDYPLEEALSPYRAVIVPMLVVLGGALIIALTVAMLIAQGVSQPLEALAATARRIAKGDYSTLPAVSRRDEIGELSSALGNMTRSIADRENALRDAIGSLELARNDAVKANEAKSQFLSNMSHELRTPLNAILGFSEVLHKQMMGPIGASRYIEYAHHIYESGSHLLVQVEEMLDLSQAADGRLLIARRRVKPSGLISASIESLEPVAAKSGVGLNVTGDPASWPAIDADGAKLQQSLTNIIHNAVKFTPSGGTVTISGERSGAVLKIVISDTGIGIPPEDLDLVVRPFHRQRPAYDSRYQGVGLGLPFAKTIIELHGGRLAINSVQGAGTTVTIELPVAVDTRLTDAA